MSENHGDAERIGHGHGHEHAHGHGHDNGHEHGGGLWGQIVHFFKPHSHDAADSVDDALEASTRGIRALKISLVALGVTAVFQLLVVAFSGSVALFADTVHNFSDAMTAVPLWIAFSLSRKLANKRYTYGFHRVEDLAGLFVVAMILLSAAVAGYEAVRKLLDPEPMSNLGWVAAAGVIGFIGNELVAVYRIRVGRQIGSAALVADGYHARTDGLTSLAVLLGVLGTALGFPIADPIVGILITIAIVMVLAQAIRQVFHRILDGVEPGLIDRAERQVRAVPGVVDIIYLRARWSGHSVLAEVAISVDPELNVAEGNAISNQVDGALRHAITKLRSATIRVEPARDHGSRVPARAVSTTGKP